MLWSSTEQYRPAPYDLEADVECAIIEVKDVLFGGLRVYLDVKKKIGAKGHKKNIPDGYLIDLSSKKTQCYSLSR